MKFLKNPVVTVLLIFCAACVLIRQARHPNGEDSSPTESPKAVAVEKESQEENSSDTYSSETNSNDSNNSNSQPVYPDETGYTEGTDGRIYENKTCSLCKGTGIETGHNAAGYQARVCPMCDGKGVRSY